LGAQKLSCIFFNSRWPQKKPLKRFVGYWMRITQLKLGVNEMRGGSRLKLRRTIKLWPILFALGGVDFMDWVDVVDCALEWTESARRDAIILISGGDAEAAQYKRCTAERCYRPTEWFHGLLDEGAVEFGGGAGVGVGPLHGLAVSGQVCGKGCPTCSVETRGGLQSIMLVDDGWPLEDESARARGGGGVESED
jgi:hypothetical protein